MFLLLFSEIKYNCILRSAHNFLLDLQFVELAKYIYKKIQILFEVYQSILSFNLRARMHEGCGIYDIKDILLHILSVRENQIVLTLDKIDL